MKYVNYFNNFKGLYKVFEVLGKEKNARVAFYFLLCTLIVVSALFSPVVLALIER